MIAEDLTPEERLFLASLQVDSGVRQQCMEAAIRDVDWRKFQLLAARHGNIPVVFQRLEKGIPQHIPAEFIRKWRKKFRSHVIYAMQMAGPLQKLVRGFAEAGIPMAAFKGPVLAQLAYGDMALRTYQDLDIMVRSRDFIRTYKLLTEEAGLAPMRKMNGRELAAWARSGREFMFSRDKVIIDLHMRITEGPERFRCDPFMETEIMEVSLLDRTVPVFKTELHFLMLALHAAKHGWPELRMAADAAHLAHARDLDMDSLDRLGRRFGCRRAVDLALWLARDLCGLEVSAFLTGGREPALEVRKIKAEIMARVIRKSVTPDKGIRFKWMQALLDHFPARAAFVWHTATAAKLTDLKESRSSNPAIRRIMRPLRLIRRRKGMRRRDRGRNVE